EAQLESVTTHVFLVAALHSLELPVLPGLLLQIAGLFVLELNNPAHDRVSVWVHNECAASSHVPRVWFWHAGLLRSQLPVPGLKVPPLLRHANSLRQDACWVAVPDTQAWLHATKSA